MIAILAVVGGAVAATAAERIALLVGVERYAATELPPPCWAEDDVEAIGAALGKLGFSVVTMTSRAPLESRRPTLPAAILEQLDRRLAERHPEDTVVVVFSGHGVQFAADQADGNGAKELWLCPEGATLDDRTTLLPLTQVIARLAACKAGHRLLVVDACRQGPDAADGGPRGALLEAPGAAVKRPAIPPEIVALFSCRPGERSFEIAAAGHGIFGGHLLEFLEGRAPAELFPEGAVGLEALVAHVRSRTRDTAEVKLDRVQVPDAVVHADASVTWSLGRIAAKGDAGGAGEPRPAAAEEPAGPPPPEEVARSVVGRFLADEVDVAPIAAAITRFRQGDPQGCRAALDKARADDPRLPPPGLMMAAVWLSADEVAPAVTELEKAIVAFPEDPEPLIVLGDLAFRKGRVTEATERFRKATSLTSSFSGNPPRRRDFEIRTCAGNAACAEALKMWDVARLNLARWLELDPDCVAAHQRMGIVLFHLGDTTRSMQELQKAKQLDAKAVQPELAMARLHSDAGRKAMARTLVQRAVEVAPQDASVISSAAGWHISHNEMEAAKTLSARALALAPDAPDPLIVAGMLAHLDRDHRTAEKHLAAALAQRPKDFAAANLLALVRIELGVEASRKQALELAEANATAYRDDPAHRVETQMTLAWINYRMGRRQEAERILQSQRDASTLTADGAYYVARILVDRGETARARELLERLLAGHEHFRTRREAVELMVTIGGSGR